MISGGDSQPVETVTVNLVEYLERVLSPLARPLPPGVDALALHERLEDCLRMATHLDDLATYAGWRYAMLIRRAFGVVHAAMDQLATRLPR